MDKKEIIKIVDRERISKVVFKYPEMMSAKAEEIVRKDYEELIALEKKIKEQKQLLNILLSHYKHKQQLFERQKDLFELEFETRNKEVITRDPGIMLNGLGNDIIGRQRST